MGDRFILCLECAWCNKLNAEIWYAPTSNSYTFTCVKCRKENFITSDFNVKKIEDVELEDVREGFEMTTNASWNDEDIDRITKDTLKSLKGKKK